MRIKNTHITIINHKKIYKMKKALGIKVAELLNDKSVGCLPIAPLIEQVIFPRVLGIPGTSAGCRYYITDRYMRLIADYADDILYLDHYRGIVCLKLALQRFARSSAFPAAPIDYDDLPQQYKSLSAMYDEVEVLTEDCWYFFRKQVEKCLDLPETQSYAQSLLLKLVENISITGRTLPYVYLDNEDYRVNAKEVRDWAYDLLWSHCGWEVIYERFANPKLYKRVPDLWSLDWHKINKKDLAKRLNVKGLFKEKKLKRLLGII